MKKSRTAVHINDAPTQFIKKWKQVLVFSFAVLLFFTSIFNDYNLDDELVTRNHPLTSQGIKSIPKILSSPYYSDLMGYKYEYRPVVLISFAIEHQFLGEHAIISHIINLLAYALMCLCLLKLLDSLLGQDYALFNFFVTLFFAAHSAHTEVVASIKNRDEILALLFALLSGVQAVRYYVSNRWQNFLLSLLFLLIGAFAKQSVINFIFLIPLGLLLFLNPVNFKRLINITAGLSILVAGTANIEFLYQKIGLVIVNLSLVIIGARYKEIVDYCYSTLIRSVAFMKQHYINTRKKIAIFFERVSSLIAFVNQKSTLIKAKLQPIKINQEGGLLEFPFQLPTVAVFIYAALLLSVVTAVAIFFNTQLILGFGLLIVLFLFTFLLKPDQKIIAFWLLTALLIALSIVTNSILVYYKYLYLYYLICLQHQFSRKQLKIQLIIQIVCLVVFPLVFFSSKWDPVEIFVPLLLFVVYSRTSDLVSLVVTCLFITLELVLVGRDSELEYLGMKVVNSIALLFAFFSYRSRMTIIPVKTIAITVSAFTVTCLVFMMLYSVNHPGVDYSVPDFGLLPPPVAKVIPKQPLPPAEPTVVKFPPIWKEVQKVGRDAMKISATLPSQKANRPLTFVESPLDTNASFSMKIGTSALVLKHYLLKVIIPYPLGFYYGYAMIKPINVFDFEPIVIILTYIFILLTAVYFLQANAVVAYGILIYLAGIAVYSNLLVAIPGIVADRFLLTPSLGYCILLVAVILKMMGVSPVKLEWEGISNSVKIIILVLLASYVVWDVIRVTHWKNKVTLMSHDISNLDESAQAHNLLAFSLMERAGQMNAEEHPETLRQQAVGHFKRTLDIYPFYFNAAYDLGRAYTELGMYDSAVIAYKYAYKLDTSYSDIPLKLGSLLMDGQHYLEAVPYLKKVINDEPSSYTGYDRLSRAYYLLHQYDSSIAVNKAATAMVKKPDPWVNIGRTYLTMNQNDSAHYYFVKADQLYPGYQAIEELVKQTELNKQVK